MAEQRIDVTELIDRQRIGAFQKKIAAVCGAIAFLEGFNTQSVGYIAPVLAQSFHLQAGQLGLFFSLGLFGLLCGALFVAPLADRVGRRIVLLYCVPVLGVFVLLTAFSTSIAMLDAMRFATGLAIGGALPNTIALTSEYAPRRRRAVMVAVMFSGFIIGSIVAAFTAGWLTTAGWRSVFFVGGSLCFIVTPLILIQLPESVRFLVRRGADPLRVSRLVQQLFPALLLNRDVVFTAAEESASRVSVRALFDDGRARSTVLLWIVSFTSLFNIFLMANWLPTEMRTLGFPIGIAILVGAVLQVGGLCGIFFGWLADRIGANIALSLAYLTGAVGVVMIPLAGTSPLLVMAAVYVTGFGILGGQTVTNAVSAMFYPTEIRSTGIGWATGIGRAGSIIGPGLAGILLQISIPAKYVILLAVIPALVAATAAFLLDRIRGAFSVKDESLTLQSIEQV
jgi:AAHS family 4-hydroxybenzoate transporter-like MFS transporter